MTNLSVIVERLKFADNILQFDLKVETDDESYKESSFFVTRGHKDFIWLNNRLHDNRQYLGIYLPKLPPNIAADDNINHYNKILSTLSRLSSESREKLETELKNNKIYEMQACKRNQQHYLEQIVQNPELRKDPFLKLFLQSKDKLPGVDRINKNSLYKKMDLLSESCQRSKFGRDFPIKQICAHCKNLQNVIEINFEVVECFENVCYGLTAFTLFSEDMGKRSDFSDNWGVLSKSFSAIKEETLVAAQSLRDQLIDGLFGSFGLINGQKYVILSNFYAEMETRGIEEDIQREETRKNDTENLKKELEKQKEFCVNLESLLEPELKRLEEMSTSNYKSALSALCSAQVESSKKLEKIIGESIAQLSNY